MDSMTQYGVAVALLIVGVALLNIPLIACGAGWMIGAMIREYIEQGDKEVERIVKETLGR